MRTRAALSLVLALSTFSVGAFAQPQVRAVQPPKNDVAVTHDSVVQRQDALVARLSPAARKQLEAAGRALNDRLERVSVAPPPRSRGAAPVVAKSPLDLAREVARGISVPISGDIEVLTLLVMAEAAREAEADLRALLEEMKQSQRSKEELRRFAEYRRMKRSGAQVKVPTGLDAMDALSETDSLRLQRALERLSRMMEALSNLLKKVADTQSGIVQNMK